jgi:type VI secretion system protein VasG
MIEAIAKHHLRKITRRLAETHNADLAVDDAVVDLIKARCRDVESGGRMVDAILTNTLLPELSRGVLNRLIEGRRLMRVTVGVEGKAFSYTFEPAEEEA